MKNKIRVWIVDDDRRTILNLEKLLNYTGKVEVSATFSSGTVFLNTMNDTSDQDRPDVVLMDIDMPEMNGIDCVLIGKARFPEILFLMLTVYDDEDKLFKAIKAGANGYLLKDEKISVIVRHLQILVYEGGVPLSPAIAAKTFALLKQSELGSDSSKSDFQIKEDAFDITCNCA